MDDVILVTGATGTVGREVVHHILQSGQHVRGLVRDAAKATSFGPGVEVVVADLQEPQTLPPAFDGARKVFVLAAYPGPDMEKMEINAFIAAERADVEHIVYLSNFGAGRFDGDLWTAHGANEWRLRTLKSTWTILRPARFMSSLPFVWTSVLDNGQLREPHGGHKVVMVDPHDIGAVAAQALTTSGHDGRIYELSGQALTGLEIADQLTHALGRQVEFVDATDDETHRDLMAAGLPAQIADTMLAYFATLRAGRWYETSTVADLLGRPPRSYQDWLRDHPPEISR